MSPASAVTPTQAAHVPDPSLDALRLAVRASRGETRSPRDGRDALAALFEAELRTALEELDADRAYEAAAALLRRTSDVGRCLRAVERVLAAAGRAWVAGACSIAQEHRITATSAGVLARLRAGAPAPTGPRVVLAAPPGDGHVLALDGMALLLGRRGHRADVVGELPADELVAAAEGASAVVLSVHTSAGRDALRPVLRALRAGAPGKLLVVGGPAAPLTADADVLTSDLDRLLAELAGVDGPRRGRPRSSRSGYAGPGDCPDAASPSSSPRWSSCTTRERVSPEDAAILP